MAVAVLIPLTATEVEEFNCVPFPNCPEVFAPQHLTAPFESRAQE
jgi:hypothetical protein